MKKVYILLWALCCASMAQAQNTPRAPKLSPLTRQYVQAIKLQGATAAPQGYMYKKHADGKLYVPAIIKVQAAAMGQVQEQLQMLGATIGTKAGDIWTVHVPYEKVIAFTQITCIAYIQVDEPAEPMMDVARQTTRVDSVHGGYNLPMPYTGKNIVMGVIDFGFDYNHPTFFDTTGSAYRVKRVWELNTTGTPPSGYTYGHELTTDATIQAQGTDNAEQSHGTATGGIAGGSGYGSPTNGQRFRGVAYESELVLVGVRRDSIGQQWMEGGFSDFIDGINYIFTYASSQSKPCVVNISWGSQSGPHDGSSLFNQACDNLSGPGKLIVMSAGNEGTERIHIAKNFTATDTMVRTFITFSDQSYKRTWIDIWGDTAKTFCANVTLYKNGVAGNTTGFFCIDDQTHNMYLLGDNGLDTCYVSFITESATYNDKPRMTVTLFNKSADSMAIAVKGTSGAIDMWDEYYYYGYKYKYSSEFESLGTLGFVNGNNASTVSDMGSAESVLLIGAYASKNIYIDINGVTQDYSGYVQTGRLVPFSSRGPMANGKISPFITAPGLTLATAMSSYDTSHTPTGSSSGMVVYEFTHPVNSKKYYYSEFIGTSASAPVASGIVALMLQAHPTLSPAQVKSAIAGTAIEDVSTGNLPAAGNNHWGHGKINAYGAVKRAIELLKVSSYSGRKLDCVVFPNPNTGSFWIDYTGNGSEQLTITVLDVTGRTVFTKVWNTNTGLNRTQIDVNQLPKGPYIVQLQAADGQMQAKMTLQ